MTETWYLMEDGTVGDPHEVAPAPARARGAGAVLAMGLLVGVGLLFHRFTLGLLPAWLLVLAWWLR